MNILGELTLLSFEVTDCCNLQSIHDLCPINYRKYRIKKQQIDKKSIIKTIIKAKKMGFEGMVAFHYYNEPLIKKEMILSIIDEIPDCNYLIWTNGLLLSKNVEENEFLKKFMRVCITCYDPNDMLFFEQLKQYYNNIEIFDWDLDDRLKIYDKSSSNILSCKRPLFEIPIDYYGNIHLCCMDWNNSYEIGNILIDDFEDIIKGKKYQNLIDMCKQRLLNENISPQICRTCDKLWVSYPRYRDF